MWASLRKLFSTPVFEGDEEKTRKARYLSTILIAAILLLSTLLFLIFMSDMSLSISLNYMPTRILMVLLAVIICLYVVMRKGLISQTSVALIVLTWIAFTFIAYSAAGIKDTTFTAYIIVILLAGLLLNVWYSIGFAIASILTGWLFAYLETTGILLTRPDTAYNMARDFTVIFLLIALLVYLTVAGLKNAIEQLKVNSTELGKGNKELQSLHADLELRVEQRTNELLTTTKQMEQRAKQLQTVADVARTTASVQDIETLLPTIAKVISEQFGYYHTGIFLNDERNEYAVLRAANSEGGKRMLNRGHSLRIGEQGIVGFVAKHGQPRIALNTGEDAVFFNNPELPNTRSEAALPLKIGEKIIGVLDVQSQQSSAFSESDVGVLSTLTNLVAVAIENSHLFSQTNKTLSELKDTYARFSGLEWERFSAEIKTTGYRYSGLEVEPLTTPVLLSGIGSTSELIQNPRAMEAISIPIKLRGQTLGFLSVKPKTATHKWGEDELAIAQAAADRVALALENARLLKDAQRKAAKEQLIGEISNKISASTNMDNILLTAIVELGQAISDSEVIIQFEEHQ
jgi:GAF domain-containing protein